MYTDDKAHPALMAYIDHVPIMLAHGTHQVMTPDQRALYEEVWAGETGEALDELLCTILDSDSDPDQIRAGVRLYLGEPEHPLHYPLSAIQRLRIYDMGYTDPLTDAQGSLLTELDDGEEGPDLLDLIVSVRALTAEELRSGIRILDLERVP